MAACVCPLTGTTGHATFLLPVVINVVVDVVIGVIIFVLCPPGTRAYLTSVLQTYSLLPRSPNPCPLGMHRSQLSQ